MSSFLKAFLPFAALANLATLPADAAPRFIGKALELPAAERAARDAAPTLAPLAFVKFCIANSRQCRTSGTAERVTLTPERWGVMLAVNESVNTRIVPDETKGGYDWSADTTFGNCNDYALQKQRDLIAADFPISALSLSVVVTRRGIGHLVLTVRTDRGDLVLDNLRPAIVSWHRTGYRWIKRQSAEDPKIWLSVSPGRTAANEAPPEASG